MNLFGFRHTLPLAAPPRSLCVLRLSAIGDVCHTLAVVTTLRSAWPGTPISWIIGKTEANLVGDIPNIEFIVYDKQSGSKGFAALGEHLKRRRFDVLLQMQSSLRASRIARHIRADIRLGFDYARAQDLQWLFTTHRIAPQKRAHALEGLFGFAQALGVNERRLNWPVPLKQADHDFASRHMSRPKQALIISPLASDGAHGTRNWCVDRYAAVADHAIEAYGLQVLLTGGLSAREAEAGTAIQSAMRHPVTNLIGQTSLKQLLAVIARARVLLCPDSGPGHMATTVGTPAISLFAGTNPDRAAPYLSRQWVVNKYPEALLTFQGRRVDQVRWGKRVYAHQAMNLITVADVTHMLDRLMTETEAVGSGFYPISTDGLKTAKNF